MRLVSAPKKKLARANLGSRELKSHGFFYYFDRSFILQP